MQGVEAPRRTARLRATIAVIHQDGGALREQTAEAAIEGVIAERAYPEIRAGFPYRAVLVIPGRNCYLGELGDEEEAQISQRRIAVLKLRDELERIAAGRAAQLDDQERGLICHAKRERQAQGQSCRAASGGAISVRGGHLAIDSSPAGIQASSASTFTTSRIPAPTSTIRRSRTPPPTRRTI